MYNIIEMCFMNHSDRFRNSSQYEKELNFIKTDIINKIEMAKISNVFIQDFLEMYETEMLYNILTQLKKEITNRNIKKLNNEL